MPTVNAARIPAPNPGSAIEQVGPNTDNPRNIDGAGVFRTTCDFSHMNFDDPIVYPGQPGRSHLHTFFGNTGTNGNSTAGSIANTGNSTCRGGILNRSSYWVPSMIDTLDGTPIRPTESHFYYKTGYYGVVPSTVRAIPPGLRMIAGDARNDRPTAQFARPISSYHCDGVNAPAGSGIPACPVGSEIWQHVVFPQCWDGVNLDSPDHKSHMAYPEGRGCPASHPVALPEITMNVIYPVRAGTSTTRWRLSSDNYSTSLPGGYSGHGDWFNGWRPEIMQSLITNCSNTGRDCGGMPLGDGRSLY